MQLNAVEKDIPDIKIPQLYSNQITLDDEYYIRGYNNVRRTKVILISCCARHNPSFMTLDSTVQSKIIRRIERSCHNEACKLADERGVPKNWKNRLFTSLYNIITYRVQKNLYIPGQDTYLSKKLVSGELSALTVGSMSSAELCPDKTKDIYAEIEERKHQKIKKKFSTQHECFKCGGRKTSERELQTRGLDEGSTLIITCEMDDCSNRWRLSS